MGTNILKIFVVLIYIYASQGAFGPPQNADLVDFPYVVKMAGANDEGYNCPLVVLSDFYALGALSIVLPGTVPSDYIVYSDMLAATRKEHPPSKLYMLNEGLLVVKVCEPFLGIPRMSLEPNQFHSFETAQVAAKLLYYDNSTLKYVTTVVNSYTECNAMLGALTLTFNSSYQICSPAENSTNAMSFVTSTAGLHYNTFLVAVDTQVEGIPTYVEYEPTNLALVHPIRYSSVQMFTDVIASAADVDLM
ncbi:uncharacterized protein LOC135946938 [Cloeon dipterum]|uniref:uncharacterized protein LOC135946938 n=1 Tax=Cloeon dipterum TaxID=197152 RepID=UPI00321F9DAF